MDTTNTAHQPTPIFGILSLTLSPWDYSSLSILLRLQAGDSHTPAAS
jgi:hypothetical protein